MMINGIMISSNIFSFLNILTTMLGRKLHMVSTSWRFVLMAVHVGLHLGAILGNINKKIIVHLNMYITLYYYLWEHLAYIHLLQ